ncbi:39S ribosomal protein L21, mitochondrial [Lemmus lemmus]
MAVSIAAAALPGAFGRLVSVCSRSILAPSGTGAGETRENVPKTSLSSPPWEEVVLPDRAEEIRHHAEVVRKVNELIATGQYGRLFAVVHFASHQWKVTSEDLILIENELDIQCGERIRLEKVRCKLFDEFRDSGTKCALLRSRSPGHGGWGSVQGRAKGKPGLAEGE